jgi:hypothetical protein
MSHGLRIATEGREYEILLVGKKGVASQSYHKVGIFIFDFKRVEIEPMSHSLWNFDWSTLISIFTY